MCGVVVIELLKM